MTNKSATVCVDSNLVVRLVLGGPQSESVRRLWEEWILDKKTLIAPPLLAFEVTSVIWREVYLKNLSVEQGRQALAIAFKQTIHMEHPHNLHEKAFDIAFRFNLPQGYDAHYVALAEHFGCELWTLDKRLYNSLNSKLSWIHTIPEIT